MRCFISVLGQGCCKVTKEVKKDMCDNNANGLHRFVVRTSVAEKKQLDMQVGSFIYATNSPFRHVEHKEFIKLCSMLRPGYVPPTREAIGNEILEYTFDMTCQEAKKELEGKVVCLALDGWSNVHQDPIVCTSVHDIESGYSYLIDTIDTEDSSHTSDYLAVLASESIKKCSESLGCKVKSFVTDNAANMAKMRRDLARKSITTDEAGELDSLGVVTFGCSAHMMNLFAKDLEEIDLIENVKKVVKYFRNIQAVAGKYKKMGGKKLLLPIDVRWNSIHDCLQSYLQNWHIISKLCSDNKALIDPFVLKIVQDTDFKDRVTTYSKKLYKIAVALDRMQSETTNLSEATNLWKGLLEYFLESGDNSEVTYLKNRMATVLTEEHFLAYLLDPKYRGM